MLNFGQSFHSFFVFDAFHLETGDQIRAEPVDLSGEDDTWVFKHRLDYRENV